MPKLRYPLPGVAAAAVAFIGLQSETQAQSMSTIEERNKAAVHSGFVAWANATGSPYDLLADDVHWTIEGNSLASRMYPSREDFMRDVIRPFNARMKSPLKPAVRSLYADGNTVIAFFDARGVASDDKPYVNTYAWFLEMKDGKIIRASAFFDAIAFNDLWKRVTPGKG